MAHRKISFAHLEHLSAGLAKLCGFADGAVVTVGESSLAELKTRPDYAVYVLKSLPNVLYTDGNGFSLSRNGELEGSVIHFEGDIETSDAALQAPAALQSIFEAFLGWQSVPPRSARELAKVSARLCRLLRDEVIEQMQQENDALTHLAAHWRKLLFPRPQMLNSPTVTHRLSPLAC